MAGVLLEEDIRALDFFVRSLALDAALELEQLAARENDLLTAARELEPEWAQLSTAEIIEKDRETLHAFAEELSGSANAEVAARFAAAEIKLDAGRMYDFGAGILTVGASALLIIVALRLGRIEIGEGAVRVVFEKNREPVIASIKTVVELVSSLLSGTVGRNEMPKE